MNRRKGGNIDVTVKKCIYSAVEDLLCSYIVSLSPTVMAETAISSNQMPTFPQYITPIKCHIYTSSVDDV